MSNRSLASRPLPALGALRAFEAAYRHASFSKAAEELHVTPAALSHQIKALEEHLGLKLFHRRPRAIAPTDAGRMLYPGLHAAFQQIRQAVAGLDRFANHRVLVISTPPGFTAKWLAPRLWRFLVAHPELDVRVSAAITMADFAADGIDVAIRNLATGVPAGLDLYVDRLVDLAMQVVASPKLIAEHGAPATAAELARLPLIHDESLRTRCPDLPSLADWFRAAGVPDADVDRGVRFNSADHAMDAAVEGAGLLLAHRLLAHDDLRTGRLVAPHPLVLPTARAFHFVCPKGSETRPQVRAFHQWLRHEIALPSSPAPVSDRAGAGDAAGRVSGTSAPAGRRAAARGGSRRRG